MWGGVHRVLVMSPCLWNKLKNCHAVWQHYKPLQRHLRRLSFYHIYGSQTVIVFWYSFPQKSEKASPRQFRYLDYICQFTTALLHVSSTFNIPADTFCRIDAFSCIRPNLTTPFTILVLINYIACHILVLWQQLS